ncbi:MAG: hypothetical protein ACRC1H_07080, partial [Caldilineaceae bacterium]
MPKQPSLRTRDPSSPRRLARAHWSLLLLAPVALFGALGMALLLGGSPSLVAATFDPPVAGALTAQQGDSGGDGGDDDGPGDADDGDVSGFIVERPAGAEGL